MSDTLSGTQWIRQGTLIVGQTVAPDSPTQPALDLSDFKYHFRIRQQDAQSPNTTTIRVYNLSDARVRTIQKEFTRVVLQAGYKYTAAGVIFDGTIVQTRRGRARNVDSYLDILASENTLPYTFAFINQTFAPGTSPKDLGQEYSKTLTPYGLGFDDSQALVGGILPRGRVAFGMTLDRFGSLCQTTGTTWVISNRKVTVVPLTGYLPGEAVVLNSQSGLIGQPESTQEGIKGRCLINPELRVGTRVQINNALINQVNNIGPGIAPNYANPFAGAFASVTEDGFYKVIVIDYEGDSRGEPWYQEFTCLAIDPTVAPNVSVPLYP